MRVLALPVLADIELRSVSSDKYEMCDEAGDDSRSNDGGISLLVISAIELGSVIPLLTASHDHSSLPQS